MFCLIRYAIRGWHPVLLAIGLFVISIASILVASAAQTTLLVADRELSNSWRTSYDILIRPAGSRSPIEEKYGLVEANHLSGIPGGITFEQYEAIKSIPGVDVVAPIAMVGYIPNLFLTDPQGVLAEPGAYVLDELLTVDDGVRQYHDTISTYYYVDSSISYGLAQTNGPIPQPLGSEVKGYLFVPFLLAGIDSQEEADLMGLEKAIVEGQYLTEEEPTQLGTYTGSIFQSGTPRVKVPALINIAPYINFKIHIELRQLSLPEDIFGQETIMTHGGNAYLATLPGEVLNLQEVDSDQIYQWVLESLRKGMGGEGDALHALPTPMLYREDIPPFSYNGLTLEVVMPRKPGDLALGGTSYRENRNLENKELQLNAIYSVSVKGVFELERLPKPEDVNRVPLESYFPPTALLRYDEQGNPMNPPRELHPTLNPAGYIQPPPLLLTTLEAARALRGDNAISAIRVRVGLDKCPIDQLETCALTSASQRKIEAIAIQIQQQTGLDVDVMVGSSPSRVLVYVPEIGYVEEQWIQKGVNLVYRQGIQSGNWLLLGILLVAGGLFTLDLTWAEVVGRRKIIALQKALGWRSRTVFAQIVGEVFVIGIMATIAATLIAQALIRLLEWQPVSPALWLILPLIVIGLCTVGSLLPAWTASRLPPMAEFQRGELHYNRKTAGNVSGLWSYAWNEIKRRTLRSILTGLVSSLSAGLIVLLVAATLQQRGMLGGTLLGEFLLVSIEGFHYAIVVIGFSLAALSTFNGLLNSALERRREIGVLRATGWRTSSVACLFIFQGLLLGLIGGSVGGLVGFLIYLYLYSTVSLGLFFGILLSMGLPGLLGALAAIYPAGLAAKIPPAEAVRYE